MQFQIKERRGARFRFPPSSMPCAAADQTVRSQLAYVNCGVGVLPFIICCPNQLPTSISYLSRWSRANLFGTKISLLLMKWDSQSCTYTRSSRRSVVLRSTAQADDILSSKKCFFFCSFLPSKSELRLGLKYEKFLNQI